MLPSTGYFKGINCPFYDSGLCERPYCHFRHVKKDSQSICSDGIEDDTLQKLVSAAVQKVLQQTENSGIVSPTQVITTDITSVPATSKVSYNPTPISELNKINTTDSDKNEDVSEQQRKHIPIPYTPRKPSVAIKRNTETNGSNVFTFIPPAKYSPGSESVQVDPYTPKGTTESTEKYLPGKETAIPEYTPDETQKSHKRNYVPSDKTSSKKKILEYKPKKIAPKSEQPSVTYQPTPKSLVPCFSSDEEELDIKKKKFSSDLNGLDDLGPEFDILDQILDEEKNDSDKSHISSPIKENLKESKENKPHVDSINDQSILEKLNKSSSEKLLQETRKINSVIRESDKTSNSKEKDRKESRSKNSEEKSSHKKSIKDEKRDKSEKKSNSNSRRTHSSSKSSQDRSRSSHDVSKRSRESSKSSQSSSKSLHESSKKVNESLKRSHENSKSSCESSNSSQKNSKSSHEDSRSSKSHGEVKLKHKSSRDTKKKDEHKSSKEKDKHKNQKQIEIVNSSDEDSNRYDDIADNSINNLSESDEEDITEECKRIFEEYVPSKKSDNIEDINNIEEENSEEYYIPTKKRISRTTDKNIKILPKAPAKPDFKVNAAQAMAERLARVREYHAAKTSNQSNNMILKPDVVKNYFSASANGNSKVRIAHVPYASTLLSAKKIITPGNTDLKSNIPSTSSSTITQTVKKGAQRVAHVPNEKFIDRPGVLEPLASKIPANIRSTYLNIMIDHCLKIYLSATDAYARAQHEELATSKKCSTVPIYKNSAVLTISRLKKEVVECDGIKKSGSDCSTLKKMPQVANKTSSTGSWSIENKNKKNCDDSAEFIGAKLYHNISKWILTEEQLKENGFPRPHESGARGRAIIYGQNKQKPPKGFIRTCCRCKKDYTVDKKGFPAIKEECIYHPNNKYRVRGEVRYQCCSQDGTSDGCCIASSHVYEYVDFENLKGFVKTLPSESVKEDYGVYSLDCEMCYTTHGLDLTRVTVINSDCKVVYETLIKPLHPIIDYNTRYSGITEEQMAEVKTTLLDVQATLLTMFNSKTILIGHSLESDFKALKLIHDTVIDTSVLFPHKMGPPYKRALRNLSSEYLKKIIQNSVDGHDSAEDATVCMELIRFKLKEDLKTR